jgi:endonuclease YncB( thermonuclease family)
MNRLKKLSHPAIILLFLTLCYSIPVNAAQYKCTRVTDGDTITVTQNGFKTTIRLVGIDAPEKSRKKHEPGQPFSQNSTKFLAGMILNKDVEVKNYGTDRYGRTLGVVYLDGKNVNLEMVKAGLAEVYRGKPAPGFDNGPYQNSEDAARCAGNGSMLGWLFQCSCNNISDHERGIRPARRSPGIWFHDGWISKVSLSTYAYPE